MNAARLSANLRMPCGTDTARRRHLARAQKCTVCWPGRTGLPAVPSDADYQAAIRGAT